MLARGCGFVMRRKVVKKLDVSSQRGTREDSLEEIVAEQRVFLDLIAQSRFKRINLVNSFPGIRTFTEEILVHVRNSGSIGIDSARARKNSLEQGAFSIR